MSTDKRTVDISLPLATDLITEQFPHWSHLPISPVELSGHDNRTFRLGEELLIRLPSSQEYAPQVHKEQTWLPLLAPHLSFSIPEPIALGQPSKNYPWPWSIYRWIEGESANSLSLDELNLPLLATQLAQFLSELHKINTTDGPLPSSHNFYRGGNLSIYDTETRSAIKELQDSIDTDAVTTVWEKALSSTWDRDPVWIHGDFSSGNILLQNNQLAAVIDFGCMGIGDPACDLVMAWTLLKDESRNVFKSELNLDQDTWARARGWALWKSLFTIVSLKDKTSSKAMKQQDVIHEILKEHERVNHQLSQGT